MRASNAIEFNSWIGCLNDFKSKQTPSSFTENFSKTESLRRNRSNHVSLQMDQNEMRKRGISFSEKQVNKKEDEIPSRYGTSIGFHKLAEMMNQQNQTSTPTQNYSESDKKEEEKEVEKKEIKKVQEIKPKTQQKDPELGKKEMLYGYKKEILGIKLEYDSENENNNKRKSFLRNSFKLKNDEDFVEISKVCKVIREFLYNRPPTSDIGKLSQERGVTIKEEDLDPTYLDYQVIHYCVSLLEKINGALQEEGIYRLSGDAIYIKYMWACFIIGKTDFLQVPEPSLSFIHILTGSLKLYLRELKEPLIPFDLYDKCITIVQEIKDRAKIAQIFKDLIKNLHSVVQNSLKCLFTHLKLVSSYEEVNKMGYQNLGIVFGPTVLKPRVETLSAMTEIPLKSQIVSVFTEYSETIFSDVKELSENEPTNLIPMEVQKKIKERNDKKLDIYSEIEQELDHNGFLEKQGEKGGNFNFSLICNSYTQKFKLVVKSWKKRYFTFSKGILRYYHTKGNECNKIRKFL